MVAESKGVALFADGDVTPVRCDVDEMGVLIRNLVDNAVRYTPAGGRVDVSVERSAATRAQALIRVVDNGPGIAREERERVFDRFYRRPGAPVPGSGLGLAIVKAIAVAHGATVELGEGADGRGLAVTVAFPAED